MLRTHSKLLHYFTRALRQMNLLEPELKVEAKLTFAAGGERSRSVCLQYNQCCLPIWLGCQRHVTV
jgi:hypothetical protein